MDKNELLESIRSMGSENPVNMSKCGEVGFAIINLFHENKMSILKQKIALGIVTDWQMIILIESTKNATSM